MIHFSEQENTIIKLRKMYIFCCSMRKPSPGKVKVNPMLTVPELAKIRIRLPTPFLCFSVLCLKITQS